MAKPSPHDNVVELVLMYPACARVLQRHRIDYCWNDQQTLAEAASAAGIAPRALVAELERAIAQNAAATGDPRRLSNAELIDHIAYRYHRELRKTLPFVVTLATRVARAHGDRNPRLLDLHKDVERLSHELEAHMWGEETSLFPAIAEGARDRATIESALLGMHDEHLLVRELLDRVRADADDFRVPRWANGDYRTLVYELEFLEHDVLRHMHVENQVLLRRFAS